MTLQFPTGVRMTIGPRGRRVEVLNALERFDPVCDADGEPIDISREIIAAGSYQAAETTVMGVLNAVHRLRSG